MVRENIKEEVNKLKPFEIPFDERLKQDKAFLISLIDDPVKTFWTYRYNGDDAMMHMLNAMAANVRERAILMFTEIMGMAKPSKGCEACDGCRACKVCTGSLE